MTVGGGIISHVISWVSPVHFFNLHLQFKTLTLELPEFYKLGFN